MVKTIKSKKSRKTINKSLKKGKRLSSKIQKGGVGSGSACVLDYASSSKIGDLGIGSANLHNQKFNPQASRDFLPFDNKFMVYGGPVPLGQMGGSNKCGDDGVGTSNPKSETFKDYINTIDKQLSFKGGNRKRNDNDNDNNNDNQDLVKREYNDDNSNNNSLEGGNRNNNNDNKNNSNNDNSNNDNSNNDNSNKNNSNNNLLEGGDYTVNPEQYIAGKPVIDGYDHENPPAIINGKLMMPGAIMSGGDANRQLCGNGATRGGSKTSKRNSRQNKKKTNKSKRYHKSNKNNSNKNNSNKKSNKNKTQNKKRNNSSKMQKGGEIVSIGSKPAVYSEAFNGPAGVFQYPDDMSKRDFGAKQPDYGVNAI